ncbi:MAG TPA: DUF5050 domain-containing protein [Cyclobacteriaceae bacterium]|nr:DUF5050 domain-containing protein [Cyclobacteriaceae bacterium]HMV10575.1 DUF5050 domain-containing protein [Cyclobacteriaceae bacterium]HMV88547.1 DUF5050 domain-containing protein [Cyclobacteriaceae bacterium]HMW99413.1 DUF5050 domain-containing protein [Cyclobacteriaceae bacterium]HMX48798.1 DUF5050 domain-containing protein [Cyclobacteriaceae bacterium]
MKRRLNLLLSGLLLAFVAVFVGACGDDETTKKATPAEELYFTDYSDGLIQKFTISNPADMSTVLDVNGFGGVGLAYDKKSDMIFFSDFEVDEEGKIWSMNTDATGLDDIITGIYSPYGIAIGDGKIYYADDYDLDGIGHIYRANLDGSSVTPLITAADSYFRAVALDLKHDKIYFYDVEDDDELGDLWIADIDGTNAEIVVPDVYGYAVAVDTKNGKIYFDDQNEGDGVLRMANLDGSGVETVDATASRIYGIAVDNAAGKIYWSARDNGEIYSADLDGGNKITLKTGLSSPRGLFIK